MASDSRKADGPERGHERSALGLPVLYLHGLCRGESAPALPGQCPPADSGLFRLPLYRQENGGRKASVSGSFRSQRAASVSDSADRNRTDTGKLYRGLASGTAWYDDLRVVYAETGRACDGKQGRGVSCGSCGARRLRMDGMAGRKLHGGVCAALDHLRRLYLLQLF